MLARKVFALFVPGLLAPAAFAACAITTPTTTCSVANGNGGPGASVHLPSDTSGGTVFGKSNGTPANYPATIAVTGAGTVTSVSVTLHGFAADGSGNALQTQNMSLILVAPGGQSLEIMRFVGDGNNSTTNVTINIADGNANLFPPLSGVGSSFNPSAGSTVSFKPTSNTGSNPSHQSPAPASPTRAAPGGSGTFANVFNGVTAAGNWSLFLADSRSLDTVSFTGWDLVLGISQSVTGTTTSLASGNNPSFTLAPNNSVTLTATVSTAGGGAPTGTVAFADAGGTISGCGAVTVSSAGANSSTAQCTTSFSAQGNHPLTASFTGTGSFGPSSTAQPLSQFVKVHGSPSGNTFCNTGSISMPGIPANQSVYPSVMNVSGSGQTLSTFTISLNSLSGGSGGLGSVQMLLVSPNGTALDFMSHGGNSAGQGSVNVTIADANPPVPFNGTLSSTTYQPTSYRNDDVFTPNAPSPAPQLPNSFSYPSPAGSATIQTTFGGGSIDGDWVLYLYDNGGSSSSATLGGGWCLNFTPNTGIGTTTALTTNPSSVRTGTPIPFTATVTRTSNGTPITSGTVKFTENGSQVAGGPANPVAVNGSGVASFSTSSLTEGEHTILATYHDSTNTFADSFKSFTVRVDNNPTTSVNGSTATYCNTGAITIPLGQTLPNNTGPAGPNPSNIFVTELPGTINTVAVTMKALHLKFPSQIATLLVAPVSNNGNLSFDFFSNTGGSNPYGTFDTLFADGGASIGSSIAHPGANAPTSVTGAQTYTTSAFYPMPPSLQFAAPHGAATFTGLFSNQIGNGTWSLYFDETVHDTGNGLDNGWCMAFTEHPPVLTGTKADQGVHFVQGQPGVYTIVVHNAGPGSAGGAVAPMVVTDTLAADLAPGNLTSPGTGWTCGAVAQVITCNNTTYVASGNDFPALTINVNVSKTAGASVQNSASISGSLLAAPVSTNTVTTIIDPAPVLSVTKTHVGTFTQGSTGEWDITVNNTKAGSKTNGTTTVVDTLPTGYTLNSFSSSGNVWTCGSITNTVTCTASTVVNGGSSFALLQLIVNIPNTSPISVTNNVVTYGGGDVNHVDQATGAPGSDQVTVVQVPASITTNAGTTPQSATVNTAFANALAVTVKDAASVVIQGANVTFTAPGSGASGTFSNATNTITIATNASGIASAPFTANTTAGGPYTVTAAVGSLPNVNFSLTNNPGAPSSMTANAGTTPQSATVNTAFTNALAVTIKDSFNNPVSGISVTFTAPGSGASGTFSNATATISVSTNSSGVASAPFTANTTAGGPYTVTAASAGLTTVNFSLSNNPGAASSMTANAGTTPQSTAVGTAFPNALAVTIKDSFNNPVSGVNVTFTAPGSGASGTFSNATATISVSTNASGVASAPFTANATVGGPYTVTAAASGLTTVNFSLTNTAGAAASMTANAGTTPQSAAIGTPFANALAVTIKDAGSNPISGILVTFTAPGAGASGTFSNATNTIGVMTNASGIASAPFTANGTVGGPYTVTAAASGLTTVNFSLTNTAGAPGSMTPNAGTTPQSATVGTAFGTLLGVTVKDGGNNPVSGVQVTFTAPASGASGLFANNTTSTMATTDSNGVATATVFTANGTAGGPYNVVASAGALSTNFSLTNVAGSTDVSNLVQVTNNGFGFSRPTNQYVGNLTVTNISAQPISGPISVVLTNLTNGVTLVNGNGTVASGPYIRIINSGSLAPGQTVTVQLRFTDPSAAVISFTPVTYTGL